MRHLNRFFGLTQTELQPIVTNLQIEPKVKNKTSQEYETTAINTKVQVSQFL